MKKKIFIAFILMCACFVASAADFENKYDKGRIILSPADEYSDWYTVYIFDDTKEQPNFALHTMNANKAFDLYYELTGRSFDDAYYYFRQQIKNNKIVAVPMYIGDRFLSFHCNFAGEKVR